MSFLDYLKRLTRINPIDYQDEATQAHLTALAAPLDDAVVNVQAAMLARLVATAPEDALELTGRERGLPRYPGEYLTAYRNRLLNAWEYWAQAGTFPGMTAALEALGYTNEYGQVIDAGRTVRLTANEDGSSALQVTGVSAPVGQGVSVLYVDGTRYEIGTYQIPRDWTYYSAWAVRIVEHYHEDRAIWAEFSVYLTATRPEFTTDAWDDGSHWDDGSAWDVPLGANEGQRIVGIINEIKPAHAKLRKLYYVPFPKADFWDDGSTWDDGSVWDLNNAIQLYP